MSLPPPNDFAFAWPQNEPAPEEPLPGERSAAVDSSNKDGPRPPALVAATSATTPTTSPSKTVTTKDENQTTIDDKPVTAKNPPPGLSLPSPDHKEEAFDVFFTTTDVVNVNKENDGTSSSTSSRAEGEKRQPFALEENKKSQENYNYDLLVGGDSSGTVAATSKAASKKQRNRNRHKKRSESSGFLDEQMQQQQQQQPTLLEHQSPVVGEVGRLSGGIINAGLEQLQYEQLQLQTQHESQPVNIMPDNINKACQHDNLHAPDGSASTSASTAPIIFPPQQLVPLPGKKNRHRGKKKKKDDADLIAAHFERACAAQMRAAAAAAAAIATPSVAGFVITGKNKKKRKKTAPPTDAERRVEEQENITSSASTGTTPSKNVTTVPAAASTGSGTKKSKKKKTNSTGLLSEQEAGRDASSSVGGGEQLKLQAGAGRSVANADEKSSTSSTAVGIEPVIVSKQDLLDQQEPDKEQPQGTTSSPSKTKTTGKQNPNKRFRGKAHGTYRPRTMRNNFYFDDNGAGTSIAAMADCYAGAVTAMDYSFYNFWPHQSTTTSSASSSTFTSAAQEVDSSTWDHSTTTSAHDLGMNPLTQLPHVVPTADGRVLPICYYNPLDNITYQYAPTLLLQHPYYGLMGAAATGSSSTGNTTNATTSSSASTSSSTAFNKKTTSPALQPAGHTKTATDAAASVPSGGKKGTNSGGNSSKDAADHSDSTSLVRSSSANSTTSKISTTGPPVAQQQESSNSKTSSPGTTGSSTSVQPCRKRTSGVVRGGGNNYYQQANYWLSDSFISAGAGAAGGAPAVFTTEMEPGNSHQAQDINSHEMLVIPPHDHEQQGLLKIDPYSMLLSDGVTTFPLQEYYFHDPQMMLFETPCYENNGIQAYPPPSRNMKHPASTSTTARTAIKSSTAKKQRQESRATRTKLSSSSTVPLNPAAPAFHPASACLSTSVVSQPKSPAGSVELVAGEVVSLSTSKGKNRNTSCTNSSSEGKKIHTVVNKSYASVVAASRHVAGKARKPQEQRSATTSTIKRKAPGGGRAPTVLQESSAKPAKIGGSAIDMSQVKTTTSLSTSEVGNKAASSSPPGGAPAATNRMNIKSYATVLKTGGVTGSPSAVNISVAQNQNKTTAPVSVSVSKTRYAVKSTSSTPVDDVDEVSTSISISSPACRGDHHASSCSVVEAAELQNDHDLGTRRTTAALHIVPKNDKTSTSTPDETPATEKTTPPTLAEEEEEEPAGNSVTDHLAKSKKNSKEIAKRPPGEQFQ
ncbi:unnamed protein product [Amoebophrya sp. A120]|nr:unnamed protein product [Amoebophrya sp. A120]|eukprot:GSA120T00020712001.1